MGEWGVFSKRNLLLDTSVTPLQNVPSEILEHDVTLVNGVGKVIFIPNSCLIRLKILSQIPRTNQRQIFYFIFFHLFPWPYIACWRIIMCYWWCSCCLLFCLLSVPLNSIDYILSLTLENYDLICKKVSAPKN